MHFVFETYFIQENEAYNKQIQERRNERLKKEMEEVKSNIQLQLREKEEVSFTFFNTLKRQEKDSRQIHRKV